MSDENGNGPEQQLQLSELEGIKSGSRYLRGTIEETLADPLTGSVPESDKQILKFHGSYLQDDRDQRDTRRQKMLEPAYQFMVRVRAPGGVVTPEQWLALDRLAQEYADGSLRLTTRQSFQLHGVLKWNLKSAIRDVNETLLDTLAACGDVNRNTMCNPNPHQSEVHEAVYEWSKRISERLTPRTKAYHAIWLDGEKIADSREDGANGTDEEPIYGPSYLPRKFKVAVAVPPSNDVDVFAHDLGFVAIVGDEGELQGFNVAAGGGMGMTYGEPQTYPNLGEVIGFCAPDACVDVAQAVATIQRDFGNRADRKRARLKYTIADRGWDWFVDELHARLGWKLDKARPFRFEHNGDRLGWVEGPQGQWHLTLFIQNGRIRDWDDYPLMTGLRQIAEIHEGDIRLTPNQNLVIGNVAPDAKPDIDALVDEYGLTDGKPYSALRRNAMACVALPTCGLAMAESERYLPELLDAIEEIMEAAGLWEDEIVVRMSGCPNGCSRPYLGEIGFTGKAPGKYNLYLGAGFAGDRLSKLYRENIDEAEILKTLEPIIHHYADDRENGERFGDFVIRTGYVAEVVNGPDFHE
ncbi:MAG: assimilatory sulfite reductase (NADPH) hemoprotein subunit [Salinibacter sp.]